MAEEEVVERESDIDAFEQQTADAGQIVERTNLGQKSDSVGPTDGSTTMEDTPAQTSPSAIRDLTVDE